METIFIGIIFFIVILAIFDLVIGVSNDAVNFINSAIGSKAAGFKVIIAIAAIGIFTGAALSNGMMDIARHGIFSPSYYSFYDLMCIFLAVMITDIVLLDIFNTLGMPTSTTVSMVFELLGGSFALALLKLADNATNMDGTPLTLNELLNSDKALSVILAIFLSVAVAFVFGVIVQWISRICFTFTYTRKSRLKTSIFGGIAITSIIWFLLINGLKGSSLMTPEIKQFIDHHTWIIVSSSFIISTLFMLLLKLMRINVLRIVVLFGTFALAMAFAGNDLVNFIGVPLTGIASFTDYHTHGNGDPYSFMMHTLNDSANTPLPYLVGAGIIMVLSLILSKKAQNVVKTSVDLSRQDEGDEMFGSSAVARTLVRTTSRIAVFVTAYMPESAKKWVNKRFNSDEAILADGAAFDLVRASVNLVLAGLLVALGTSLKLPLSTTYVTFMVAMGSSLADRAWSRESAVFRITGVLSVIGGWFITAGAAFVVCYIVTTIMFFGKFAAMGIMIALAITLIIRSNIRYAKKTHQEVGDKIFAQLIKSKNQSVNWHLLCQHIRKNNKQIVEFVNASYKTITDAFFHEEYRRLKQAKEEIEEAEKEWKRQRKREIIGLRRINPMYAIERNTWFFLSSNSCVQMLYCLKRINDPNLEHVGNNFTPIQMSEAQTFITLRDRITNLFARTENMLKNSELEEAEIIRSEGLSLQATLSRYRKKLLNTIQDSDTNIESMLVFVNIIQESQELIGCLRHMVRGITKFQSGK